MSPPTWRIGTRLLLAQGLVLVATIATAAAIAALIGPPLFHEHMMRADQSPSATELTHVEEAFRTASVISLGFAVAAALVIALLVSWYLTRRFETPIADLTRAASKVSSGSYDVRVPVGDAGPELDSLAVAFNTMATRLAQTEDTRRRLLSDLAHELRTPVATLTAYLEGLDDGVTKWNDQTQALFVDQVHRLSRLAGDIDEVSKAEEGRLALDLADVSVTELVDAALRAHAEAFQTKGVELTCLPGDSVFVEADRNRLLQVLANLLDNALRHTPPGGNVKLSWTDQRGTVAILVQDSGDGITAPQLPHVFERFYRGDTSRNRQHQGSGIGLTISRGIAEAHEGTLEAISEGPGTGATFVLTVPTAK